MTEDEAERAKASRALRITSWASAFCLITTDILGPFSAPYAVSQVGWVPGVILYFFSWVHSLVCGYMLTSYALRLLQRIDTLDAIPQARLPSISTQDIRQCCRIDLRQSSTTCLHLFANVTVDRYCGCSMKLNTFAS